MKFTVLLAAALASVAIASPVLESDAESAPIEVRDSELDARQRGDCAVGVYFGDYGCYYNTSSRRHFIGVCERNGSITVSSTVSFCLEKGSF